MVPTVYVSCPRKSISTLMLEYQLSVLMQWQALNI